jgi:hypothetical protein
VGAYRSAQIGSVPFSIREDAERAGVSDHRAELATVGPTADLEDEREGAWSLIVDGRAFDRTAQAEKRIAWKTLIYFSIFKALKCRRCNLGAGP